MNSALRRHADLAVYFGKLFPRLAGQADNEPGPLGAEITALAANHIMGHNGKLLENVVAAGIAVEHIDAAEVKDAQLQDGSGGATSYEVVEIAHHFIAVAHFGDMVYALVCASRY